VIDDAGDSGTWMTKAELAAARGISIESVERLMRRHRWRRQPGNDSRVRVLVPSDWMTPRDTDPPHRPPPLPVGDPPAHPPPVRSDVDAVEAVLAALREAHAGEIAAVREAHAAEKARAETQIEHLRGQITVFEFRLTTETARADAEKARADEAEQVRDAARKRTHELANRMMRLEAEAEEGRETKERLTGLDRLLADAEHRLTQAEDARRAAQERVDAQDRAAIARQGRGRWARLRAAWRGE
jgi:hypothetical protein